MEQKNRAWIYCRIDAPEDAHGSLKGQRKELMDYAEQMDFVVTGYSEDLGSGMDYDRSGLAEVLNAAEEAKMEILLIKKLDRLGRDTVKTMELFQDLKKYGIQLYSPMEGEIRMDYHSPSLSMQ